MSYVNRDWHTHKLTPGGDQTRMRFGLSDKAASLVDGLVVAVRIDEMGKFLGVNATTGAAPSFRDDLCQYLAELESRLAATREPTP